MRREDIYKVFDQEREYQLRRWGHKYEDGNLVERVKTPEEYVVYAQHYLTRAIEKLSTEPSWDGGLHELRKVATLLVKCFEDNGVPERDMTNIVYGRD